MSAIWDCKIGEVDRDLLPLGGDAPMRQAVAEAYYRLTGKTPDFIFSGWGGELTEGERAVVENRDPVVRHMTDEERADSLEVWREHQDMHR